MTGPLNPVLRKRVLAWLSSAIDDELARRRHGELFEQLYRHLYAAEEILQSLWLAGTDDDWEALDHEEEELRSARQYLERKLAAHGAALCSIKDLRWQYMNCGRRPGFHDPPEEVSRQHRNLAALRGPCM